MCIRDRHPPFRGAGAAERPGHLFRATLKQHVQLLRAKRTAGDEGSTQPRGPQSVVKASHTEDTVLN
eukprot:6570757-Alexandrium_andersonii.AAC.1